MLLQAGTPAFQIAENAEVILDERLRQLHGLWLKARLDGRLPPRSFIDPIALRFVIGSLLVFEVVEPGPRYRYRLVGTDVVDHLGMELTGIWLDEHPDRDRLGDIMQVLTLARQSGQPVSFRYKLKLFDEIWPCESLVLPISNHADEMPEILAGQIFPSAMPRWRRS